jgi:hypothetical protein
VHGRGLLKSIFLYWFSGHLHFRQDGFRYILSLPPTCFTYLEK